MKTISDKIAEIKKELDDLESQISSTISILDCKSIPLNNYPSPYDSYKPFKWNEYFSGIGGIITTYKDEETTLLKLEEYKVIFDKIHESNKDIILKNKETFNKICLFLEKLGLSKTHTSWCGKGKSRRSFQQNSDWVADIERKYPMIERDYDDFISWYQNEKREINRVFSVKIEKERRDAERRERENKIFEEERKKRDDKNKALDVAIKFLISNGKKEGVDFNKDNAINVALGLKTNAEKEVDIKKINTINPIQFLQT